MAAGVDPLTRYLVLGGLGWVGWNWANAQPTGSWARQMIDQARVFAKSSGLTKAGSAASSSGGAASSAPAPAAAGPAPAPGTAAAAAAAPVNQGNTPTQQYNELEADGNWYQITQWSDGSFTSWLIPPAQWPAYGIPTGGAGGAVEGPPQEAGSGIVQKHDDGSWYVDIPFTDGSWSSQYIDPSQYVVFGILPDGSAVNPFPTPGL